MPPLILETLLRHVAVPLKRQGDCAIAKALNRESSLAALNMFHTCLKKLVDMVVAKRIVHHAAVLALLYQTQGAEDAEMLGHSGLRNPEQTSEIADAQLFLA